MMILKLKTLGVTLVAVCALGAVVASAASAQQAYLTGDGPLKDLTGQEIGAASANRLTALGTFTHCNNSTYTITQENGESFEHTTTVEAVPTYKECKSTILGITTHVDMHGCRYVYHVKEATVSPSHTYRLLTTLKCTGSNRPTVTITSPGTDCTLTITPTPAGYSGLDLLDTTTGVSGLDIKGTLLNLTMHATVGCPGEEESTEGSLDVEMSISGDNSSGSATAIGISLLGESTSTP